LIGVPTALVIGSGGANQQEGVVNTAWHVKMHGRARSSACGLRCGLERDSRFMLAPDETSCIADVRRPVDSGYTAA
jgi:hypothetical protein